MGFIVAGYCHETIEEARIHFADVVVTQPGPFYAHASAVGMIRVIAPSGSPGSSQVGINIGATTGSELITLPTCETEYENGFMPWAGAPGGGGFVPPITPELAGALIGEALIVFLCAWCWRNVRGVS